MERACYASTLFLCYCLIGTKHVCPKKHHLREYFLSTETHDEKLSFGLVDSSTLLSNLNYANLFQHVQAFPKLQRKYVLQVKRLRFSLFMLFGSNYENSKYSIWKHVILDTHLFKVYWYNSTKFKILYLLVSNNINTLIWVLSELQNKLKQFQANVG